MSPAPDPPTDPTPPRPEAPPRRVIVLGSTGSVGVQTLRVIEHLRQAAGEALEVVGLAAGRRGGDLEEQARRFGGPKTALAELPAAASADGFDFTGPDAAQQLVENVEADLVVAAVVGVAGLSATAAALRLGRDVALANKETLVAAGELVMPLLASHGGSLRPVDSEHAAIAACLAGRSINEVERVVLTASGGPFRDWSAERMRDATPDQALRHPNWDMGPKITIDSATMMNKALEVIEAHHLFGLPAERIAVVVHPQSVVHGFVELKDHGVLAQLGPPDMRGPIQAALTHPHTRPGSATPLDWATLGRLDFEPPDEDRFPALALARRVITSSGAGGGGGGGGGATLNAANEAAVAAFLERRIPFGRIVELAAGALDALPPRPLTDLDDVYDADRAARAWVEQQI
ncbi:MAG: 1-deoxy-D-xylulose-5-phosphate reductoisomerase [Planctomycetota bacterium]